jgi:predicted methyltransferase
MKYRLLIGAVALALAACSKPAPEATSAPEAPAQSAASIASEKLDATLAAQSEEVKARYAYRHPKETLEFFGIQPGMTVIDTLPGDVWYAGLLLDYLGPDGKVIGASYSKAMWKDYGRFAPAEEELAKWTTTFTEKFNAQRDEDDAAVAAVHYGEIPDDVAGTVDAVLIVRAIHHFMRLENQGGHLTALLQDLQKTLKPGGIVGVVAHRAPEGNSDAWATGDAGYVKQSAVIAAFEKGGFELVEASEINANPKDQPTDQDRVWRLPPTLGTSRDNPELRAQMEAIGESDRMTLKFRKPI